MHWNQTQSLHHELLCRRREESGGGVVVEWRSGRKERDRVGLVKDRRDKVTFKRTIPMLQLLQNDFFWFSGFRYERC